MKGGLERNQLIWLGVGVVFLVLAGLLAWMGLSQLSGTQEQVAALAEKMGNPTLASFLADPAGISKVNRETAEIQKLEKELREKDGEAMRGWVLATEEAYGKGKDWSQDPGKWKDRLILVQNELQKNASAGRVQMAPEFYLGLDAFRQRSPAPQEVPELALHLSVAKHLVEQLIEARKVREQYATVCEIRSLSGPGSEEASAPTAPASGGRPGGAAAGPDRKIFRLEMQCSPEVLDAYVRLLAQDSWFFILKDLSVTNPKKDFPPRSEIEKKFHAAEAQGAAPAEKKLLEILAGDEKLEIQMTLEFVAWRSPEDEKTGGSPEKKP